MSLKDNNRTRAHSRFRPGKLALAIALTVHGPASANIINVDASLFGEIIEVVDDGNCSLKEAILNANLDSDAAGDKDCEAGSGADIIVLPGDLSFAYTFSVSSSNFAPANTGLPQITDDLIIRGSTLATARTTIHRDPTPGTPEFRLFKVTNGAELSLENLLVENGKLPDGSNESGGAIFVDGATITLKNSVISNNEADTRGGAIQALSSTVNCNSSTISYNFGSSGGGIDAYGSSIDLDDCTISNNAASTADGGGLALTRSSGRIHRSTFQENASLYDGGGLSISEGSTVTLSNSVVNNNLTFNAAGKGGGIAVMTSINEPNPSVISITNSTISNNFSGRVSAISAEDSMLLIDRSTISGNTATGGDTLRVRHSEAFLVNSTVSGNNAIGDTIAVLDPYSSMSIKNVTITSNIAGNKTLSTFNPPNAISMSNVIMAGNTNPFGNCDLVAGVLATLSNNWFDDLTCNGSSDGNPGLGPLTDNGGQTLTHALLPGSGAIDAGNDATCATLLNIDQRGKSRSGEGVHCDIGAYEITGKSSFFSIPLKNGKTVIFGL